MKEKIKYLPTSPGCYLFKDSDGKIIYIGKARNLRKRVSSYFQKKEHDAKTELMISKINSVDTIVTPSEVEAFLLESNLIKKYRPQYNLDLKDSYRYAYLKLNDGNFPWIEVARKREKEGEYFGPFVSSKIRKNLLEVLERNFKILTRKPSPRLKKILVKEDYSERIENAKKILNGQVDVLIKELEEKMKNSSEKTYYEHALTLRNQINALKSLKQKQIMEMTSTVDLNAINFQHIGNEIFLIVFYVRKGVLEEKQSYNFDYYEDFFEDFLTQFYSVSPIPNEIIVPVSVDKSLEKFLSEKKGKTVKIFVPQKGDKKELLDLVFHNIITTFFAGSERINELKKILQIEKIPRRIECYDISHLGGKNTVASMVTFVDGLPEKSSYRKFRIRTAKEGDDYQAIREVIERRFTGMLKGKLSSPDLIVIDGGKGQLNSALSILNKFHFEIPVIGLAKKFEEIFLPEKNEPLKIDTKNKGLQLLQAIRDEAHRFAISYQKNLRMRELR